MAEALRRCRVCRTQAPKAQLERWVLGPRGFEADPAKTKPGRGYYTDKPECAQKILKMKVKP